MKYENTIYFKLTGQAIFNDFYNILNNFAPTFCHHTFVAR